MTTAVTSRQITELIFRNQLPLRHQADNNKQWEAPAEKHPPTPRLDFGWGINISLSLSLWAGVGIPTLHSGLGSSL